MAVCLRNFYIANPIHLRAAYLPEKQNTLALKLNRFFSGHHKWSLHPGLAWSIFQLCGTPQIDLFATRTNRKYQFCTQWGLSPGLLTEAFLYPGRNLSCTFSPCSFASQDCLQSETSPCSSHPCSTGMASSTLVLDPNILSVKPLPSLPLDSDAISWDPGCLFHTIWQCGYFMADVLEAGLSKGIQKVLLNSRKPSSRSTCLAKWKCFSIWSHAKGVSRYPWTLWWTIC